MLKLTFLPDSDVVKSLTGMATRPKEIVPEARARGAFVRG